MNARPNETQNPLFEIQTNRLHQHKATSLSQELIAATIHSFVCQVVIITRIDCSNEIFACLPSRSTIIRIDCSNEIFACLPSRSTIVRNDYSNDVIACLPSRSVIIRTRSLSHHRSTDLRPLKDYLSCPGSSSLLPTICN